MKKITGYFVFLSMMLLLCSCDFMRKVAGRPLSADISAKAALLEKREREIKDSLDKVAAYKQWKRDQREGADALEQMGCKISEVFSFGQPEEELQNVYSVIIGVYRNVAVANRQIADVKAKGYDPYTIHFKGGVQAVVLYSSDDLKAVSETVSSAKGIDACPKDAWIYRRAE